MKGKRSKILYEVTALVVILLIAAGFLTFFFVDAAFDRMIDKSIEKVIEEQAKTVHTGLKYVAENEAEEIVGDFRQYSVEEMVEMTRTSMETGEISELGEKATERLQKLVEDGVLGVELILFMSLARPPLIPDDSIVISTDEELFNMKVPEAITEATAKADNGGKMYMYLEDGVPELALYGEYLMSLYDMSQLDPLFLGTWGAHFVPMKSTVADIKSFYESEKSRAILMMAVIIGSSVLLVIFITFFVLSYLIRKQITDPIDSLASSAGEVMEGNLDVDVEVHEGGDFEGLERAFREMLESIRNVIDKSIEE